MNNCLNSVEIDFEKISSKKKPTMIEKNLALVKWKKTVPELAYWSNQMLLDFCLWLIKKEELCSNEAIETAKK